jgi:hypothetical protein
MPEAFPSSRLGVNVISEMPASTGISNATPPVDVEPGERAFAPNAGRPVMFALVGASRLPCESSRTVSISSAFVGFVGRVLELLARRVLDLARPVGCRLLAWRVRRSRGSRLTDAYARRCPSSRKGDAVNARFVMRAEKAPTIRVAV